MQREDLYYRLNFLVPNSKFCFWKEESKGDKGYEPALMHTVEEWRVAWYAENAQPMPSVAAIKAVDPVALDASVKAKDKVERNKKYEKDLSVVAALDMAQKTEPLLKMTDYLDRLEAKMKSK